MKLTSLALATLATVNGLSQDKLRQYVRATSTATTVEECKQQFDQGSQALGICRRMVVRAKKAEIAAAREAEIATFKENVKVAKENRDAAKAIGDQNIAAARAIKAEKRAVWAENREDAIRQFALVRAGLRDSNTKCHAGDGEEVHITRDTAEAVSDGDDIFSFSENVNVAIQNGEMPGEFYMLVEADDIQIYALTVDAPATGAHEPESGLNYWQVNVNSHESVATIPAQFETSSDDNSGLEWFYCGQISCSCEHGIGSSDECNTDGTGNCVSCDDFYHTDNGHCIPNVCECDGGTAVGSASCVEHGMTHCESCESTHFFPQEDSIACVENSCFCTFGNSPTVCSVNQQEECESCDSGYHMAGSVCELNVCDCANGTPVSGTACTEDGGNECDVCDGFYSLSQTDAGPFECNANVCECEFGTPAGPGECHNSAQEQCDSCLPDYYLFFGSSIICKLKECVCENGAAVDASNCATNGDNTCATCDDFYHVDADGNCAFNQCTCDNGDANGDGACSVNNGHECASCDTFYELNGNSQCQHKTCHCSNGTPPPAGQCTVSGNQCTACNSLFHDENGACVANVCTCANGMADGESDSPYPCSTHGTETCTRCNFGYQMTGANTCTMLYPVWIARSSGRQNDCPENYYVQGWCVSEGSNPDCPVLNQNGLFHQTVYCVPYMYTSVYEYGYRQKTKSDGSRLRCNDGDYAIGTCASNDGKDCNNDKHASMVNCVDTPAVNIDMSDCYWETATNYGKNKFCKKGYMMNGFCAGGGGYECDNNYAAEGKCCKMTWTHYRTNAQGQAYTFLPPWSGDHFNEDIGVTDFGSSQYTFLT